MELFRESRDRVRRAKVHRNAFADHWNAMLNPNAYEIVIEQNTQGQGTIKAKRLQPARFDAALELGEYFYQLRAALDCLVFTAVRKKTGDPVPNEDSIYFPISINPESFEKGARNLSKLPDHLKTWLKCVQPYAARKGADIQLQNFGNVLELLHDCARRDRHRMLTVLAPCGSEMSGSFVFTPNVHLVSIKGCACNLFENESILANFRLAEYVPGLHVDLDSNLVLDVVMENRLFKAGQFGDALDSFAEVVKYSIVAFETAFPDP